MHFCVKNGAICGKNRPEKQKNNKIVKNFTIIA